MNKNKKNTLSDIETLNVLHRKTVDTRQRLNERIAQEMERTHERTEPMVRTAKGAEARENLFKARMDVPVKYDTVSDEYFLAKDKDGKEIFRILITESKHAVVEVAASCLAEAIDKACVIAKKKGKNGVKWTETKGSQSVGKECSGGSLPSPD